MTIPNTILATSKSTGIKNTRGKVRQGIMLVFTAEYLLKAEIQTQ